MAKRKKAGSKKSSSQKKKSATGSIATNLHEGSRSEYLAQYVFSSFGTAIPVPHQEDTGLDVYCTLLESIGRRAWPRAYYSVQVKCTMDPWVFSGPESVQWLIEHPLPIFLCIVQKAEARILVYHTAPRFAAWIMPTHKKFLKLIPGTDTKAQGIGGSWVAEKGFELKAPILNFTIEEALDATKHSKFKEVLKFWIDNDMENIFRIRCGNPHFHVPDEYETNTAGALGGAGGFGHDFTEQSIERAQVVVKELLGHITKHHFDKGKLVSAAIYATALRRLSPIVKPGEDNPHRTEIHTELNRRFGMTGFAYQAVDSLRQMLIDELAKHGVAE
jgi:hypothetical protein